MPNANEHESSATEPAVVIAGGGPTGMMLGAELTLAGIDVVVVERRVSRELDGSRAGGLHARTIEVLDQRGVVDRFLAEGTPVQVHNFAGAQLDLDDFPTRHPYSLGLWQSHFERILGGWLDELGVPILWGLEIVGFSQDASRVDVELSDGAVLRAQYLVGCDGGRSVVRKCADIDFVGLDAITSWIIAEVEEMDDPKVGLHPKGGGLGPMNPAAGGGPYRVVLPEQELEHPDEATLDDLKMELVAAYGSDFGVRKPNWISRFNDASRQATSYRAGRVLLAGDAAHIHPPQGGQGLNTGVQDAVNLGWKLAQVVRGESPDALLDTYHAERHPVGARAIDFTSAAVAISTFDDRHQALRELVGDMLGSDEPRKRLAGRLSGLDIHYDVGEGHPLLGWRMPDLDIETSDGPTRVYELLHDVRPIFLNLGEPAAFDIGPWADRVRVVDATYDGQWELPVLGPVPAPSAVLIRPDGHIAWAGEPDDPALPDALTTWFGPRS